MLALGTAYKDDLPHIYHVLVDYMGRRVAFWDAYGKTLPIKYLFFGGGEKAVRYAPSNTVRQTVNVHARRAEPGLTVRRKRVFAESLVSPRLLTTPFPLRSLFSAAVPPSNSGRFIRTSTTQSAAAKTPTSLC